MKLTRLILCACVGTLLGVLGVTVALSQHTSQHNARLTCSAWEEHDSYRHFLFGRIAYCRPRSTSIKW
jgi:hypothetical protein